MKMNNKHKALRLLAAATALMLVLTAGSLTCFAGIPEAADYFYVADYAEVLSDSTEQSILAGSEYLDNQCGAQIVVATVNFTDGMDMEDYAYKMFNSWEIGSSSNNGLLILLSIGDDNYWVMPGKGLEKSLPASTIQNILDEKMEPSFALEDYDAAVLSSYDAFYDEIASIYGISSSDTSASGQTANGSQASPSHQSSGNGSGSNAQSDSRSGIMRYGILLPLILLIVILLIFRKLISGGRSSSYQAPPAHRSAGRQRPGSSPTGSFSSGKTTSTSQRRSSGMGTAAGIGAGIGLGMMLNNRNSRKNNNTNPPHHASAGRPRPGAPGSMNQPGPGGPAGRVPSKGGMPYVHSRSQNSSLTKDPNRPLGQTNVPGSGAGRTTSSRIGGSPQTGKTTSSSSFFNSLGSIGSMFSGGSGGGSGSSGGGRPSGGFSGGHHSGGGGSSRGGGAGRR